MTYNPLSLPFSLWSPSTFFLVYSSWKSSGILPNLGPLHGISKTLLSQIAFCLIPSPPSNFSLNTPTSLGIMVLPFPTCSWPVWPCSYFSMAFTIFQQLIKFTYSLCFVIIVLSFTFLHKGRGHSCFCFVVTVVFYLYTPSTEHHLRHKSMSSINILLNKRMNEIPFPNILLMAYILHSSIQYF